MSAELEHSLDVCEAEVLAWVAPLEELSAAEVGRLESNEAERAALAQRVEALQQRAASVA